MTGRPRYTPATTPRNPAMRRFGTVMNPKSVSRSAAPNSTLNRISSNSTASACASTLTCSRNDPQLASTMAVAAASPGSRPIPVASNIRALA